MYAVTLLCVGKMKEKHYIAAFEEYRKRLGAFCKFDLQEIPEQRLSDRPSEKEIDAALNREAEEILRRIPKGSAVITLCVEGKGMSSPKLAEYLERLTLSGTSHICFIVGGSFGLHESVKQQSVLRLSMSEMTFPHHLARVMLMEQIYRAFTIQNGSQYHK